MEPDTELKENPRGWARFNVAVIGDTASGKSTLVGRLLWEAEGKNEAVENPDQFFKAKSRTVDWTTTDYRLFELPMEAPHHPITLFDCPGRRQYIKNTVAALACSDAAIVVVSGNEREFEASIDARGHLRDHVLLAYTFGIRRILVAVNKADQNLTQAFYNSICERLTGLGKKLGFGVDGISFIPVSATRLGASNISQIDADLGINNQTTVFAWLQGLSAAVKLKENVRHKALRVPLLESLRVGGVGTVLTGRVVQGTMKKNDQLTVLPGNVNIDVGQLQHHNKEIQQAPFTTQTGIWARYTSSKDCHRGHVIVDAASVANKSIGIARSFEAQIVMLEHPSGRGLKAKWTPQMFCHTAHIPVKLVTLKKIVDKKTGRTLEENPVTLKAAQSAVAVFEPLKPIVLEAHNQCPALGRFVLRDHGKIVAAGVIRSVQYTHDAATPEQAAVKPRVPGRMPRAPRQQAAPITPEALEMARKFEIDDFVDVRASSGKWHAAQILNKDGVVLYVQYVDGEQQGEEQINLAQPNHRFRIASLGSFTAAPPSKDFAAEDPVEVLLSAGALGEHATNQWVNARVIRIDGLQVYAEYELMDRMRSTWFHIGVKEVRKVTKQRAVTHDEEKIPVASFGLELADIIPPAEITRRHELSSSPLRSCFFSIYRSLPVVKVDFHLPPHLALSADLLAFFDAEIVKIHRLRHPNLLRVLSRVSGELAYLTEYCSLGSLYRLLHSSKAGAGRVSESGEMMADLPPTLVPSLARQISDSGEFSPRQRLGVAVCVAQGLKYLHNHNSLHGNLHSANILLESYEAKLADYGLAVLENHLWHEASSELTSHHLNRFAWMPLEQMQSHPAVAAELRKADLEPAPPVPLTPAVDIWAFGCVLIELFSTTLPWENTPTTQIYQALQQGQVPPQIENVREDVREIAVRCLAMQPGSRPSANELVDMLVELRQSKPEFQVADENQEECVVCLDDLPNHRCMPCGHVCMCANCALVISAVPNMTCPFCRVQIDKIEKVQ
eukprot:TRINITY_DN1609_c0_g3_i3.p1 TRINITY_DN1609_c0_g3~~TRINITY_DN1609_c0_g3_i3.p1  ORF type:complete len:1045 (-),score=309.04 TRINITY_DN1609_c0_g3_i3:27-3059(-)